MTIKKLQEILNELSATLLKLLEATRAKQEVLINRDHENLNALLNLEQKLISKLNELSNQQKAVTGKLKNEYQVPGQLDSLSEILELIHGRIDLQQERNMKATLIEIKERGEELGEVNAQNKLLIETSRDFIKGIIQAVRGNDNRSLINRKM